VDGRISTVQTQSTPSNAGTKQRGALVIAHLAFAQQHDQRAALTIADGVPLGVQAALGTPDTSGNSPPFEQAGRRAVRLEVGRVDHQPAGFPGFGSERGEDPVEHAQSAPADEAVVDHLMRSVLAWRICASRNNHGLSTGSATSTPPMNQI